MSDQGCPGKESASVGGGPGSVPTGACIGLSGGRQIIKRPVKSTRKNNKSKKFIRLEELHGT